MQNHIIKSSSSSKTDIISIGFLFSWWLVLATHSLVDFGVYASILFLIIPLISIWLNPRNAILFLLASIFLPTWSLELPRPFASLVVTVFLVRIFRAAPKFEYIQNKMSGILLGWLIVSCIMALFSSDPDSSVEQLFVHLQTVLFSLAIMLFLETKDDVFYSLQWLCFFAGAAFLINFCHWTWFADAYLTQKISSSVTTVYMITKNNVLNPVDNTLRFLWAGLEPNYFAASLIFPLFASTGFAFHSAKGWRFVWLTIVSLCILGLVGTYSRSAFIVTGIFLILLLLMFKKESVFKIIVFAFGLIILISNIPSIQDRFLSIEENIIYEGGSGRLERSLAGLKLYFEQPLGRGLGSSNSLFSKNDYLGVEGSHNTYLLVLLETGPHGLLLFLSIILLGISGFFRAKMLFCVTDIKMRLLLNSIIFGSIASAVFVATIPMGDYKFFFLPSIFGYSLYHFVLSNTNSNLLPIPQVSRKI